MSKTRPTSVAKIRMRRIVRMVETFLGLGCGIGGFLNFAFVASRWAVPVDLRRLGRLRVFGRLLR